MNEHGHPMDAYMNSLTTAARLPQQAASNNRSLHQGTITVPSTPEQDMQKQVEDFNRSVTIVFWYKTNTDPIRLQQTVPTFPYFQLSQFTTLVSDLGLNASLYLDTYNPTSSHWEQHTVSTVRIVESQQRLLYRARKSLLEGLPEDECLSLREELKLQMTVRPPAPTLPVPGNTPPMAAKQPSSSKHDTTPPKPPSKRSVPDTSDPGGHLSKIHISNGYYMSHGTIPPPQTSPILVASTSAAALPPTPSTSTNSPTLNPTTNTQNPTPTAYLYPTFYMPGPASPLQPQSAPSAYLTPTTPTHLSSPASSSSSIPYHPHPPLKRWPNDYTVYELSAGFAAMDSLISQSPSGASMTQRTAFERVFGSRYVKSTVCRHRAVWRKAPAGVREQFEAMGGDERACWGEFVRRVEGRPPGKAGGGGGGGLTQSKSGTGSGGGGGGGGGVGGGDGDMQAPQQQQRQPQVMAYHGPAGTLLQGINGQQGVVQEDGSGKPVMDSLQSPIASQGTSSSNKSGQAQMQSALNVYDPNLNHLSAGSRTV